jgi:hypothetical protein
MKHLRIFVRPLLAVVYGAVLAVGGAAHGATLTLQRIGSGPVSPNGLVTVEVYANGVLLPDTVRAYQVRFATQGLSGSSGTLTLAPESLTGAYRCIGGSNDDQLCTVANSVADCPGGTCSGPLFVDETRADWVFGPPLTPALVISAANLTDWTVGSLVNLESATTITEQKYLGTAIFQASSNALGNFEISLVPGDDFTFLQCPDSPFCRVSIDPVTPLTVSVALAPANDNCAGATTIVDGSTAFSTQNATTDGPSHAGSGCDTGDGGAIDNDIWFNYTASCNGILTFSTCGAATFDTKLGLYTGHTCPVSGANLVACSDDATGCSGGTSRITIPAAVQGTNYKLRVGGKNGAAGTGTLTISCVPNDTCASALSVGTTATANGTTIGATVDSTAPACGNSVTAPGVWYTVTGNGGVITASLCDAASYDTRLSVFSGTCASLSCIGSPNNTCSNRESLSWCSTSGVQYYILVHGAGSATGTFTLRMTTTSCNDNNQCTNDSCSAGVCSNTPNYNTSTQCCNPATGGTTVINDNNPCTTDTCDPGNGQVSHTPVPNGPDPACDDGLGCTVDECFNGACRNVDVGDLNIPCTDDGDCPGDSVCADNVCVCGSALELVPSPGSLPEAGCYAVGDIITVRVELAFVSSNTPIVGAQFFLAYDATTLDFISIDPGQTIDPTSPFALELNKQIDEMAGTIDYLVGLDLGEQGTTSAATLAVAQFEVIAECEPFIIFRPSGPNGEPNRLSASGGVEVLPGDLIDLPFLSSTDSVPVISGCPSNTTVGSDPGELTAVVTWAAPTAIDDCEGATPVECVPPSGSAFNPGTTSVTCNATNSCGLTGSCGFTVTVEPPTIFADIELSSNIVTGPITRCIVFDVWDCDAPPGPGQHATVQQNVTFVSGLATNVEIPIPGGNWTCLTARDPLHTLRSTAVDFTTSDNVTYDASFVGSRTSGGHWLLGGNLNGDNFIDILDFGMFMDEFFSPASPNTPCGTVGPDANFNGDNVVDLVDFVFIQVNSFKASEPECCPAAVAAASTLEEGPIRSISLMDLQRRGLFHLAIADLNNDGVLDEQDIAAFLNGARPNNPAPTPAPTTKRPTRSQSLRPISDSRR